MDHADYEEYLQPSSFEDNASYPRNIQLLYILYAQKKYAIGAFSLYNVQLS